MALTLRYDFAKHVSLVAAKGPTLGIVRATTGTYFDSSGVMQTAGTNVARFDHNPSTGESLGLLVEPAETNICLQSEDLSTTWTNVRSTDAQSAGTAPDGTNNFNSIDEDGSNDSHYVHQAIVMTNTTPYTLAAFVKASNRDWCLIQAYGLSGIAQCYFDLSTGVVGTPSGTNETGIQDLGNGVYRCWINFTTTTVGASNVLIAPATGDAGVSFQGLSQESILVWGVTLEATTVSKHPASYMPTTTISAPRNTDLVTTTDLSWLDDAATAAGTFYVAAQFSDLANNSSSISLQLDDGTSANRILMYRDTAEQMVGGIVSSGGADAVTTIAVAKSVDTTIRHVFSYANNNVQVAADGTLGVLDTDALAPMTNNPTTFRIGHDQNNGLTWDGHIAEIRYYDERIDDATLEDMSNGIFPRGLEFVRSLVRPLSRTLARAL